MRKHIQWFGVMTVVGRFAALEVANQFAKRSVFGFLDLCAIFKIKNRKSKIKNLIQFFVFRLCDPKYCL